jgi:hypothetical protein
MEAAKQTVASAVEQLKAAAQTHGERLSQTLRDAGLVPGPAAELIPEDFRPRTVLEVSYGSRAVDLGNSLFRVRETKVQPVISFQREVSKGKGKTGRLPLTSTLPTSHRRLLGVVGQCFGFGN